MKALTLIGLVIAIVGICAACSGTDAGTSSQYISNGISNALTSR
jgi:hypothetical protein